MPGGQISREMALRGPTAIPGYTQGPAAVAPRISSVTINPCGIPRTHTAPPAAPPDLGSHIALGPNHKEYVSQLARNDFSQHSNLALWANISRQNLQADITQRLGLTPADAQALKTFDSFTCKARCSLIMLLENKIVSREALKAWLENVKKDPAGANAELFKSMPESLDRKTEQMLVQMGTDCKEVQGVINMAAAKAWHGTSQVWVNQRGQAPRAVNFLSPGLATFTGTTGEALRAYLLTKRASILLGNRPLPQEVKTAAKEAVRHALHHGKPQEKEDTARWLWNNKGKISAEPPAVRLSLLHRLTEAESRLSGLTSGDINQFIVDNREALLAGLDGENVDQGTRAGVRGVVEMAVREVVKNSETSVSTANSLDKWLKDNGMASEVIEHNREWCVSRSADDIAKLSVPEREALLKVLFPSWGGGDRSEEIQFVLRNRDALLAGVGDDLSAAGQAVRRKVHKTMSRVYGDAKTSSKQRGEILQWLSKHPEAAQYDGAVDWTRGASATSPINVPAGLKLSENDQGILRILQGMYLPSPLGDIAAPEGRFSDLYSGKLVSVPADVLVRLRPDNPTLREFVDRAICEKFVANHDVRDLDPQHDPCFSHLWERRDALIASARPEVRESFAKALITNSVLEGLYSSSYGEQHQREGIRPLEWLQQKRAALPSVKVTVSAVDYEGTPAAYQKSPR